MPEETTKPRTVHSLVMFLSEQRAREVVTALWHGLSDEGPKGQPGGLVNGRPDLPSPAPMEGIGQVLASARELDEAGVSPAKAFAWLTEHELKMVAFAWCSLSDPRKLMGPRQELMQVLGQAIEGQCP